MWEKIRSWILLGFNPRDKSASAAKRRKSFLKNRRYHTVTIRYKKHANEILELEKTMVAVKTLKGKQIFIFLVLYKILSWQNFVIILVTFFFIFFFFVLPNSFISFCSSSNYYWFSNSDKYNLFRRCCRNRIQRFSLRAKNSYSLRWT